MDSKYPEVSNRREFLERLGAASAAALAMGAPRAIAAPANPDATADCCILIWMAGGMAAPDTFDPKHYVPFKEGVAAKDIISTFPSIDTVVDDIKFTKGLENVAGVMDRGTIIRSAVQPDLGHILHSRHQYHWHTGYVPPQTVAAPHMGAWIAKILGPRNPAIPAFIDIGQRLEGVGEKEELKAFHTAGFLGSEYGPFLLPYPDQAMSAVKPPAGMTPERFERRYKYYRELVKRSPIADQASEYQQSRVLGAARTAVIERLVRARGVVAVVTQEQMVAIGERAPILVGAHAVRTWPAVLTVVERIAATLLGVARVAIDIDDAGGVVRILLRSLEDVPRVRGTGRVRVLDMVVDHRVERGPERRRAGRVDRRVVTGRSSLSGGMRDQSERQEGKVSHGGSVSGSHGILVREKPATLRGTMRSSSADVARIVALTAAATGGLLAQTSDQPDRASRREDLEQRCADYRRLRLAEDWIGLYALTHPTYRRLETAEQFKKRADNGAWRTHTVEAIDIGFTPSAEVGVVRFRVVEERPARDGAAAETRTTVPELEWHWVDGRFRFTPRGFEIPRPERPAQQQQKPQQPPAAILEVRRIENSLPDRGQWRGQPAIGDLDGDGHIDLVTSQRRVDRATAGEGLFVFCGDGQGRFREELGVIPRTLGYGGAALADVDRDGLLDIGFSCHDVTPRVFLQRRGANGEVAWNPSSLATDVICADVALGDFDRDGHVDLVSIGQFPKKGGLELWRGTGNGDFERESTLLVGRDVYGSNVTFSDLDHDGAAELVAALSIGVRVFEWDPERDRAVNVCEHLPPLQILGSELSVVAEDFDGDGIREILVCGYMYPGHAPLWGLRKTDGTWQPWATGLPGGESFFDLAIARFEPDGAPILIAAGQWGIQAIEHTDSGAFRSMGRIEDSRGSYSVGAGDFTGDGRDEIVFIGQGGVRVYELARD